MNYLLNYKTGKKMSKIQKKFQTKHTTLEMKNFINANVLPNPALKPFLETTNWINDTLHVTSKLGKGTIILRNYEIEVDIDLNFLGKMAKGTLESTLDKEFKQLNK